MAALQGPARFHARVAANVVAMVAHEFETEEEHLAAEWQRLADLLEDAAEAPASRAALRQGLAERNARLAERIRAGEADSGPFRASLLAHLRATVDAKMAVSRPPRQGR